MRRHFLFFLFLCTASFASSQSMVQIKGVIYDADSNSVLDSVTVIVKHTSRIMQNKADGSFSVFVKPTDTLIFGLYGFKVKYLCLKDSALNTDFLKMNILMYHLNEEINEITINEPRSQRDIRREVKNLVAEYVFSSDRASSIQSPISYLYEMNSKKAQSKRLLVEYNFELAKKKLIGELLDIYTLQGIIQMKHEQYEKFIESLGLSWDYLLEVSDYDLAVFIKQKAIEFENQ